MVVNKPIQGVGIGLRHAHLETILETRPEIPWLEVHTENFFSTGSPASRLLEAIRTEYPLSAHCVGLSLGSNEPVRAEHLEQVRIFIRRFQPALVSDHLSWSGIGGHYTPDLLPVPYTEEALAVLCRNIEQVQETLGRQILIENPSSYLRYAEVDMPEETFLVEAAKRSGCGILLDVNNVHVSARNHGFDAEAYLAAIPQELVQEVHLAGYTTREVEGQEVCIDDHGAPVYPEVWELYAQVMERLDVPTLIEWDTNVPELSVLLEEKAKAEEILTKMRKAA